MPNSRFYSSTAAVTNLQSTIGPGDNSLQVASSSGFPNSFPFTLSVDYGSANEELVDVTSGGPSVFNITRAVDGTSAITHNAGAVVRHVSSARDFTDSRTHEASSSGVHGITGSFVDTASTQTLSNKTLNAPTINNGTVTGTVTATGATINNGTYGSPTLTTPTINGATVSGTVAGTPTHSGLTTFSAGINTEGITELRPNATDVAETVKLDADAFGRRVTLANGSTSWGSGAGATDVTLSRTGAGTLGVTGNLSVSGNTTSGPITSSGVVTGTDLSLTAPVFTTFTPVWHGHNADMITNTGWYYKVGKIVTYEIYTVFSTSSSLTGSVSVDLPTAPFRTGGIRQQLGTVWFTEVASGGSFPDTNCMGHHCTFAGDTGVTTQPLKNYRDNTFTGGLIVGPSPATIITINGQYREA